MKLAALALGCCMLSPANPAFAQSGDPISGTWTGDAGLNLTNRTPIKFELKFDGKTAVTGAITGPNAPEFKAGTFDTTTGALRLEVELKGDGGTPGRRFVFEGTAISGVATGRVSDGTQYGSFRISKEGADSPASTDDAAAALRKSFTEVSGWVSKAAELVPADKYTYQPTKSVRSFGQLIAHLTDSYNHYCAAAGGGDVQWSDPVEKGKTDKATLLPKLKQAVGACTSAYAGTGRVAPLLDNVAHTNLHYGNIITYLRMLGLTPPSS